MYPAGGVATFRRSKTGKEVVLGGGKLVVPAGVGLHMPITAVHHAQGIWENPHFFTPERFLEVCGTRLSPVAGRLGVCIYGFYTVSRGRGSEVAHGLPKVLPAITDAGASRPKH